jgi:ribosomal protein S12 methylthiotransferase accessory factor
MEIHVRLAGGKKVVAEFDGYQVVTDQPKEDGGEGTAPGPFDLFLVSLGTCAGYFVQSFCQARGIASEGIEIVQSMEWNEEAHLYTRIRIEIRLPQGFPEKYRAAVLGAVNGCTVKKHLLNPPQLEVVTVSV